MSVTSARVFAQRGFRRAALSVALTSLLVGSAAQVQAAVFKEKFFNNFNSDFDGFDISRPNPTIPDRTQRMSDPDGRPGSSYRLKLLKGDTGSQFRTSSNTEPRAWISNHDGYTFKNNSRVRYTFSVYTPSNRPAINANFAQVIGDGNPFNTPDRPLWMLKTDGNLGVLLSIHYNSTNTSDPQYSLDGFKLPKDTWVKFVVDFDFRGTSSKINVEAWVGSSKKVDFTPATLKYPTDMSRRTCHWDGGIYNRKGYAMNSDRELYIDDFKIERYE
jgi:hypothetical protein